MTSFKLDSLSIFLILLFVIVFAMVFKSSWDSMVETKEGFSVTRDHVADEFYYNFLNKKVLTETISADGAKSYVNFINYDEENPTQLKEHKNQTLVYVPFGDDVFIHVLQHNQNTSLASQIVVEANTKVVRAYSEDDKMIVVKDQTADDFTFDSLVFQEDSNELKTVVNKTADNRYFVGMKYKNKMVIVIFTRNGEDDYTLEVNEQTNVEDNVDEESGDSSDPENVVNVKFGDYEINLPQSTAEDLASTLGSTLGGAFSNTFVKNGDYNNEYIHKTEVVPGFGYDYYHYPQLQSRIWQFASLWNWIL